MGITQHFTLREMFRSDTANRLRIDNTTDDNQIISNLTCIAINILEPVRQHYSIPFSPTSAYRCLELNRALNSKDTSQHVSGNAVDMVIPTIPTKHLFLFIKDNLEYDQLILEHYNEDDEYSGWVHASFIIEKINRNEAFAIPK